MTAKEEEPTHPQPHTNDDQPNAEGPTQEEQPKSTEESADKPAQLKPVAVFESEEIANSFKKLSIPDEGKAKTEEEEEEEEEEEPGSKRKVMLKSSDDKMIEVEESVIRLSKMIKNMIEDNVVGDAIPVQNVTAETLGKVIEYCRKHSYRKFRDAEEMNKWDEEFVAVDRATLSKILVAANFLEIEGLLDLGSKAFAMSIKDLEVAEVRAIFGIVNDFTPEEEEKVRRENPYGFA